MTGRTSNVVRLMVNDRAAPVGLLDNGDWVKPVTDRRSVVGGPRSGNLRLKI